jgi:hypothetical protein
MISLKSYQKLFLADCYKFITNRNEFYQCLHYRGKFQQCFNEIKPEIQTIIGTGEWHYVSVCFCICMAASEILTAY